MPNVLRGLKVTRVDLVDKGANQEDGEGAHIMLYKRAPVDKKAETFAEQGQEEKVRSEVWNTTDRIGDVLRNALFHADDDQDPESIILTSLEQFTTEVKAALPHWLAGEPFKKNKEPAMKKMSEMTLEELQKYMEDKGEKLTLEESQEVTKELQERLTKSAEDNTALQTQVTELETAAETGDGDDDGDGDGDGINKSDLPESVRKHIEGLETTVKEAKATADAEREARLAKEYREKADKLTAVPGEREDLAKSLRAIDEHIPEDLAKSLMETLEAMNQTILSGALGQPVGHNDVTGGDAGTKIEKMAEEIRKADPEVTIEQARSQVYDEHPKLAAEFREEQGN